MICFLLAVLNLIAFYKQWGFVKLERLSGQFVFDTTLKIFGATIPLSAFVDTGNQAIEPLSGKRFILFLYSFTATFTFSVPSIINRMARNRSVQCIHVFRRLSALYTIYSC